MACILKMKSYLTMTLIGRPNLNKWYSATLCNMLKERLQYYIIIVYVSTIGMNCVIVSKLQFSLSHANIPNVWWVS